MLIRLLYTQSQYIYLSKSTKNSKFLVHCTYTLQCSGDRYDSVLEIIFFFYGRRISNRAPVAQRAAKQSITLIRERKGNPWIHFLVVIMISGIACGRVCVTTTKTKSCNMAAILQLMCWPRHAALVYSVHLWYWTSMLWLIDTCQKKGISYHWRELKLSSFF